MKTLINIYLINSIYKANSLVKIVLLFLIAFRINICIKLFANGKFSNNKIIQDYKSADENVSLYNLIE